MDNDKHAEQEHVLDGEGQGGGSGGTVGNELTSEGGRKPGGGASPTPADPDAWDANLADDERVDRDDLRARGTTAEDLGETEGGRRDFPADEPVPGAELPSTADAVEGGTGRS